MLFFFLVASTWNNLFFISFIVKYFFTYIQKYSFHCHVNKIKPKTAIKKSQIWRDTLFPSKVVLLYQEMFQRAFVTNSLSYQTLSVPSGSIAIIYSRVFKKSNKRDISFRHTCFFFSALERINIIYAYIITGFTGLPW